MERLKRKRKLVGFTQLALALEIGMHPSHIAFLETGRTRPTEAELELIHTAIQKRAAKIAELAAA